MSRDPINETFSGRIESHAPLGSWTPATGFFFCGHCKKRFPKAARIQKYCTTEDCVKARSKKRWAKGKDL